MVKEDHPDANFYFRMARLLTPWKWQKQHCFNLPEKTYEHLLFILLFSFLHLSHAAIYSPRLFVIAAFTKEELDKGLVYFRLMTSITQDTVYSIRMFVKWKPCVKYNENKAKYNTNVKNTRENNMYQKRTLHQTAVLGKFQIGRLVIKSWSCHPKGFAIPRD